MFCCFSGWSLRSVFICYYPFVAPGLWTGNSRPLSIMVAVRYPRRPWWYLQCEKMLPTQFVDGAAEPFTVGIPGWLAYDTRFGCAGIELSGATLAQPLANLGLHLRIVTEPREPIDVRFSPKPRRLTLGIAARSSLRLGKRFFLG